ncbi:hypothetical protein [Parasphingorhabdus sp.]|uniref:hypothetical protein n=1 Tax=Parasphingorhabdus sp. TaxID=2709688 RepID=UPI003A959603
MKQLKSGMCIVNPALVVDIAPLVGGMADIMTRIGISWNTWNKISTGQPVRYSVAQRFQARIVAKADEIEALRAKFPATHGGIDRDALSEALLLSNA